VAHRDQAHYVASETDFRHRRKRAAFSHGASRQVAHREKSAMIHVITLSELAAIYRYGSGHGGFRNGVDEALSPPRFIFRRPVKSYFKCRF
jgi:hypothetical protein